MKPLLLCLDIGTSSCKAVIFDSLGFELARGIGKYALHYPGPAGYVEQHTDEIWTGVCQAIRNIMLPEERKREIAVITISSQISSHLLIGHDNKPLCNIINWMDTRAADEAELLKNSFTQDELHKLLGASLPIAPAWPIPKLRWFSKHMRPILDQSKYIVQPKEWIIWNMTGRWVSDVSSLRGLVHQKSGLGSSELLNWAGTTPGIIPPLGVPHEEIGMLTNNAARQLNLQAGLPVILGWNDLNAAVLGLVGMEKQLGFDVTGTSEHIGIVISRQNAQLGAPMSNTGLIRIPYLYEGDLLYGVTSAGGFAFEWFMENIEGNRDYDRIMVEVGKIAGGTEGLLFLPYLNGERSPWWNSKARGTFFGLSGTHTRAHMARAVLEGVAFALKSINERHGTMVKGIRTSGGSARNSVWNQIKANILGIPFEVMETQESGCLGAAILAAYGIGIYGSIEEATMRMIRTKHTIVPDPSETEKYNKHYLLFIELYHALEPLFPKIPRYGPNETGRFEK
jgi:xylulokinase